MKKASSKDIAFSVVELIHIQQYEKALELLERGIVGVQSFDNWSHLARVFEAVPSETLENEALWRQAYTAVLVGLRDEERLMEFTDRLLESYPVQKCAAALSDRTWALINQDRYKEAEHLLALVIPHLEGWRLGMAWRRLAQARFFTGGEWQLAFAEA